MHHTRSASKKTGLLVSVRSAEEATIAVNSKCVSIIDLKEPANGSLGCVSIETANEVLEVLPVGILKSIALGEVVDWPVWANTNPGSLRELLCQFDFVKIGLSDLAGDPDWVRRWRSCLEEIPDNVQRVAVAYADSDRANSPSIEAIIESANNVGCSVLLVDTFCKQYGGLLDLYSRDRLSDIVFGAGEKGLEIVLAGSLDVAGIELTITIEPDFVAVRGAVCCEGRTSKIDATKIQQLSHLCGERQNG